MITLVVSKDLSHSLEHHCIESSVALTSFFESGWYLSKLLWEMDQRNRCTGRQATVSSYKPPYSIKPVWSSMCTTCNSSYSCSPAFWVRSARVTHVTNACYELWKMKTVALNTDILAASIFQFSNQPLQRVEVCRVTYLQLEDIISPGKEQKCYPILSITIILVLIATWKQTLLLCFGIAAMFSACGFMM